MDTPSPIKPTPRRGKTALFAMLAVILLVAILRIAAPSILGPWLQEQIAAALDARTEIDDVDLDLVRGGGALNGLRIYARDEPDPEALPLFEIDRLAVRISLGALWDQHIKIVDMLFTMPRLKLLRDRDGKFNIVEFFVRPDQKSETSAPAKGGWEFSIDQTAFEGGRVILRDLTISDATRFEGKIKKLDLTRLTLSPDLYTKPGRIEFAATVEGAPFSLVATIDPLESGQRLTFNAEIEGLPLAEARAYMGDDLGWTKLRGRLSANLEGNRGPENLGTVRGAISVADVAIEVEGTGRPGLLLGGVDLEIERFDLEAKSIALKRFAVSKGMLTVLPSQPHIPVLAGASQLPSAVGDNAEASEEAAEGTQESLAAEAAERPESAEAAEAASDWKWRVADLVIADSAITIEGPDPTRFDIKLSAQSVKPEAPIDFDLEIREREGRAHVQGRVNPQGPRLDGNVSFSGIDVARLAALAVPGQAAWLERATLEGELKLGSATAGARDSAAESGGQAAIPDDSAATDVSGTISLSDFQVRGLAEPGERAEDAFEASLSRADFEIESIRLADSSDNPSLEAKFGTIRLVQPQVRITRTAEGIELPKIGVAESQGDAKVDSEVDAEVAVESPDDRGEPSPQESPQDFANAAPPFSACIASIIVTDGSATFVDRSVSPHVDTKLTNLKLAAEETCLPGLEVGHFRLSATGLGEQPLVIEGQAAGAAISASLEGIRIALPRFNPYAEEYSDYAIESGSVSLDAELSGSNDSLDLDLEVVLHDFEAQGARGENLFRKQFGVPLQLGIALLRNPRGNIVLDFPIERSKSVTSIDFSSTIYKALSRGIANALISPLRVATQVPGGLWSGAKSVGALLGFTSGDDGLRPVEIQFSAGEFEPTEESLKRLKGISVLLTKRPSLAIRVQSDLAGAGGDVQLAEQRMQSTEQILVKNYGVQPERVRRAEPIDTEPANVDSVWITPVAR